MTSAPMSASISVQVGPAMTWVRSTTFNPLRGPIVAPAILFLLELFAAPLRPALVEKRRALTECCLHAETRFPLRRAVGVVAGFAWRDRGEVHPRRATTKLASTP